MRRVLPLALVLLAGCSGGGDRSADRPPARDSTPAERSPAPAPAPPAAGAERWPQPERYALDLAYDARRFTLSGEERIRLRNTGPEALARVWLRTWGNAFGGCGHRYVRVRVTGGGRAGAERVRCTALEVRLPEPLEPGGRAELRLAIAVTAPGRADRFGRFRGAGYFGNALPLLAVATRDGWALPPYTFHGESFFSLSASWDLRLRLPPGTRAATTGAEQAGAEGALHATADAARDLMIVAGPLRETRGRAGDVTVRHWTGGAPGRDAERALGIARRALTTYARWFGAYGRTELDVVDGPRAIARGAGLAMEYPELVLSPAHPLALAHEIAHQWWYGIVGDDEYREPWLDESFASYAAYRLTGRFPRCPPQPWRPPLTASMAAFDRAPRRYGAVVYDGGACALRALAHRFGRARFDALLRRVVEDHRDGVLTTEDFVAALRAAAPAGVDAGALLRRAGIRPR